MRLCTSRCVTFTKTQTIRNTDHIPLLSFTHVHTMYMYTYIGFVRVRGEGLVREAYMTFLLLSPN